MQRGRPERRPELLNDEDYSIISRYGTEYRGIVQYYLLAGSPVTFTDWTDCTG